jgi:hypothetical protein
MPYKNKEQGRKHALEFYYKTKPERRKHQHEYYLKNIEVFRKRASTRRYKVRQAILNRLGGKCTICGFSDWRALQIDHINGHGHTERVCADGEQYHKRLLRLSDVELKAKYQILCANCNWIKKYTLKENRKFKTNAS